MMAGRGENGEGQKRLAGICSGLFLLTPGERAAVALVLALALLGLGAKYLHHRARSEGEHAAQETLLQAERGVSHE